SADAGSTVTDTGITDSVQRLADRLHHGSGTGLLVHTALEITLAQSNFLEVAIGAGNRVATVQLDVAVCPLTVEASLTPGSDVTVIAAQTSRGEHGVQLSHGQTFNGVILVCKHSQSVDSDRDLDRLVAILLFECL